MPAIATVSGFTPGGSLNAAPRLPPCRSGREGSAGERADEVTEIEKISLQISIHPSRDRIRGEGQDHNVNRRLHISCLSRNNTASVLVHVAAPFSIAVSWSAGRTPHRAPLIAM
jgi:hypothetical protein